PSQPHHPSPPIPSTNEKEDSPPSPLHRPSLATPSSPITISTKDSAGHNHLHHPSSCSFLVYPTKKKSRHPSSLTACRLHATTGTTPPAARLHHSPPSLLLPLTITTPSRPPSAVLTIAIVSRFTVKPFPHF
ncbi:hypothetical protein Dimus_004990, partial [Dionaea muscipula]